MLTIAGYPTWRSRWRVLSEARSSLGVRRLSDQLSGMMFRVCLRRRCIPLVVAVGIEAAAAVLSGFGIGHSLVDAEQIVVELIGDFRDLPEMVFRDVNRAFLRGLIPSQSNGTLEGVADLPPVPDRTGIGEIVALLVEQPLREW